MNKESAFSGEWHHPGGSINVRLPLISFKEDKSEIVYCPALDVSGYGLTEKDAFDSFLVSLGEFFRYTLNKKTFHSELSRMGWIIKKHHKMIPPEMSYLLEKNDNFNRIFNTHDFKKYNETISIPVACE